MSLLKNYINTRNYSKDICKPLKSEDYGVMISDFASPAKWHLAHTTWFFETFILKKYLKIYVEFDPDFNFLFNSYYNNIGSRILRTDRGNMTRPVIEDIYKYRAHVDKKITELLSVNNETELFDLVTLGINHEQQHQELLLTDLKYMFGHNPLFPAYKKKFNLIKDHNKSSGTVKIKEGIYEIGYKGKAFCYDNELGTHKVYINDFEINNFLVTNKEFLEFMENDGYSDFNLWLDEGWSWVQTNHIDSPLYWHKINNVWHYYTLAGLQKIDPDALLCHINYYEANAFAEWKGMRLPTEFEWETASEKLNWGKRWEWTGSSYLPYPNFKKANGAVGEYNGKFMCNQMVLRGASVATSKNHSRNTYRNFFHPNDRWQFTGIRLVN